MTKTANGEFTRTYDWTIDKTVSPDSHSGLPGDTFSSDYTVTVERTQVDSNFTVSGIVTVSNPTPTTTTFMLADTMGDSSSPELACPESATTSGTPGEYVLAPGETLECSYSTTVADGTPGVNTVNVTSLTTGVGNSSATAPYEFEAPTSVEGPAEVTVTDSLQGTLGGVPATTAGGAPAIAQTSSEPGCSGSSDPSVQTSSSDCGGSTDPCAPSDPSVQTSSDSCNPDPCSSPDPSVQTSSDSCNPEPCSDFSDSSDPSVQTSSEGDDACKAVFTYSRESSCPTDPDEYTDGVYTETIDNIATIVETEDSARASVTNTCYGPKVSKTATATYDENHDWTVSKSVTPTSQSGTPGQTLPWTYTTTITETPSTSNYSVVGDITVENPSPDHEMTVDVSGKLNDSAPTADVVDCDSSTEGDQTTVTVPAAGSKVCSYTATPADDSATANTATATLVAPTPPDPAPVRRAVTPHFSGTKSFTWSKTTKNGTATVTDPTTNGNGASLTAGAGPWTYTGPGSHTCAAATDPIYGSPNSYSGNANATAVVQPSDSASKDASAITSYTCIRDAGGNVSPTDRTAGTARLRSTVGCVTGAYAYASVTGKRITKVTYRVNGKVRATLTGAGTSAIKTFTYKMAKRSLKVGRYTVVATVKFAPSSATSTKTFTSTFNRCSSKVVKPKFTG